MDNDLHVCVASQKNFTPGIVHFFNQAISFTTRCSIISSIINIKGQSDVENPILLEAQKYERPRKEDSASAVQSCFSDFVNL